MPSGLVQGSSAMPVLASMGSQNQSSGNWFTNMLSHILPYGGLIDSGIGLISGIANNMYDRNLQQQIFNRDDTTLDRTMAAYRRNGLNPLLGLPNATAGNTKGFEPAQLQSDFNSSYVNKLATDRLKLDNWKAKEDLKVSRYDAEIRGYEAQQKRLNAELEAEILKSKINAAHVNKEDYFKNSHVNLPYSDAGVDYSNMTQEEKAFRYLHNQVSNDPSQRLRDEAEKLVQGNRLTVNDNASDGFYYNAKSGKDYDVNIRPDGSVALIDGKTKMVIGYFDNFKDALNYADDYGVVYF